MLFCNNTFINISPHTRLQLILGCFLMAILQESKGKYSVSIPLAVINALEWKKGDLLQVRVRSKTEISLKQINPKEVEPID